MTSYPLIFIFDQSLKQWLTGRKRKEDRNYKNLNISRTERAFYIKQKTFSVVFEGLSFGEKQTFDKE